MLSVTLQCCCCCCYGGILKLISILLFIFYCRSSPITRNISLKLQFSYLLVVKTAVIAPFYHFYLYFLLIFLLFYYFIFALFLLAVLVFGISH